MKIQTRFVLHLLLGMFIWMVFLSLTIPFLMEGILPPLGFGDESYEWLIVVFVGVETFLCILWFGWYFASPLMLVMKWIKQLASEDLSSLEDQEKIYSRKGKLRMRFRLYREVIQQLDGMRVQLQKAQIERVELEKAKRDWIAGISHDLKTPLTYIKGYSTLLLNPQYEWSRAEQHSFIQEIEDKGEHMEQLVQDLNLAMRFDGSQHVPIHKSEQNIVSFVQQVLADVSSDLRAEQHGFELKSEVEHVAVAFDAHLLKRALQNIYINGIVHNLSSVMISTKVEKLGDSVVITIEDNGIGMSEETQEKLFNQYYRGTTTEQKSEGTGLGMAIVKSLIEAHKGTITVESALQHGTIFTITLPISE